MLKFTHKLSFSLIFIIGLGIFLFHPRNSFATFVEQMAICTKSISMANTVTAEPPGIMSIHCNPAGLSSMPEGKMFLQGFTFPLLKVTHKFEADPEFEGFFGQWGPQEGQEHDPVAGTEDTNSSGVMYVPIYDDKINFLIAPGAGLSVRKPGSKWTFAIANYAPLGGGMNHKSDSYNNYGARTIYIQHMVYAAPAVSFQATPTLAVGLAVGTGQTAMGLRLNMRAPNEMVALTRVLGDATANLEIPVLSELTLPPPWFGGGMGPYESPATLDFQIRDDFTPNYNLGLHWTPKKWFSFGLVYQSEITSHLTGGYNFRYSEQWQKMMAWQGSSPLLLITSAMFGLPTGAVPYQSGTLTGVQKFAARAQAGIMLKPTKRLKVLFDIHWNNWSVIRQDTFNFDQDIQMFQLVKMLGYTGGHRTMIAKRNLEDTIHWSTALEYQLNRKVELRCGYEYRPTSVQDNLFDSMYFVPDLHNVGIGAGINLPHGVKLDLALGCLFNPSHKTPNNTSTNANSTDFWNPVYNPYAGLDIEQKTYVWNLSFGVQMPFHAFIEHQKHLMHKQHEAIGHLIHLLKKPFEFLKKTPAEGDDLKTGSSTDGHDTSDMPEEKH